MSVPPLCFAQLRGGRFDAAHASDLLENTFAVDSFGWALLAALLVAAVSVVLEVIFGTTTTIMIPMVTMLMRPMNAG